MLKRRPKLCDAYALSVSHTNPEVGVELTLGIENEKGVDFMREIATIHMDLEQAQYMYEALRELFDAIHKN